MTAGREQVRRDAEAKKLSEQERREAQATLDNIKTVNVNGAVYVPKSWMFRALKSEAELEQAERDQVEAWHQCDNFERIAREQAEAKHALWLWRNENEPRLASVPALVEALRKAGKDLADVGSAGWDSSRWRLRDAAVARVNAALTVYEQSQGKP